MNGQPLSAVVNTGSAGGPGPAWRGLRLLVGVLVAVAVVLAVVVGVYRLLADVGAARHVRVTAGAYSDLEKHILTARAGDLIDVPAGLFVVSHPLRLSARGVTLKGAGKGRTVLDFHAQRRGRQGLEIAAPGVLLADLTLRNALGDGVVVRGGREVSLRRMRVEWTAARRPAPGTVGVRVVQAQDVLIDRVEVYGANEAGIALERSRQVIVQNSSAAAAAVGIAVTNCEFVDVMRSLFTRNSIGVVVLNRPNMTDSVSNSIRVLGNRIVANGLANPLPATQVLGSLPAGIGVAVVGHDRVAVFDNDISGNPATGVLIASYLFTNLPYQDPLFDPYAESVHLYGNRFAGNGSGPSTDALRLATGFLPKGHAADIMRDGFSDNLKLVNGRLPEALRLCLHDNGRARFVDLDATEDFSRPSTSAAPYACTLPPLRVVLISPR